MTDLPAGECRLVPYREAPVRLAFYGRAATKTVQGIEAARAYQVRAAWALVQPRGGAIVAEFFDAGRANSVPWSNRPQAAALLEQVKDPGRGFDAVVIGTPNRALSAGWRKSVLPLFTRYAVPLWLPETGGPIDVADERHALILKLLTDPFETRRSRDRARFGLAEGDVA